MKCEHITFLKEIPLRQESSLRRMDRAIDKALATAIEDDEIRLRFAGAGKTIRACGEARRFQ